MAEQEWIRPQGPVEAAGTAWAGKPQSHFELRPLSLGELLDRTFSIYRSRFWLFAGIAMVAASINVVGQSLSLTAARHMAVRAAAVTHHGTRAAAMTNLRDMGSAQLGTYLVMLVFVLVSAVTQAGTALALTEVYLERPTSVKHALGTVLPHWYRWIGIAIWQGCSMAWIPAAAMIPAIVLLAFGTRSSQMGLTILGGVLALAAVLGGIPAGVILYLRNALAVPAAVTEGLSLRAAMRRSKVLAAGTKGRIFVVLLIAVSLLEVVAVLQTPVAMLMMAAPNQEHYLARGIALLIAFVGHSVVAPVALIGLTLVYFDQRVRKEALDLELLLQHARGSAADPALARNEIAPPEGYVPLG